MLTVLEILYAAKARLERGKAEFEFANLRTCTCGHIYTAATGRRSRALHSSRELLSSDKFCDAIMATARALGWEGNGGYGRTPDGALWFVSDATKDIARHDNREGEDKVTRADALELLNRAIAVLEAEQEQARLDVLAQAKEIVDAIDVPEPTHA